MSTETHESKVDGEVKVVANNSSAPVQDNREKGPQGRYVKLEDRLGSGAYKDVWRAYDTHEGREVAWNVVKLNRIPPNERKRIKTEVKLLKDIVHKNIIKYYNSWVDREKEQIVFITEIMSHGSLKDYLRRNPMIRWNAVKRWCRQILHGLQFLHEKQIIHRDIKCDNIFINGSTGDVRIGDLGLSTRISEERALQNGVVEPTRVITTSSMTCLGTPEFMAPELYEEVYSEKVDIYAFGMAVLEMVTGCLPYHDFSAAQIYKKVLNGELPPELDIVLQMNPRAGELIKSCLRDKNTRPSATELLENEFLLRNDEEDFQEVRTNLWQVEGHKNAFDNDDDDMDDDGILTDCHSETKGADMKAMMDKPGISSPVPVDDSNNAGDANDQAMGSNQPISQSAARNAVDMNQSPHLPVMSTATSSLHSSAHSSPSVDSNSMASTTDQGETPATIPSRHVSRENSANNEANGVVNANASHKIAASSNLISSASASILGNAMPSIAQDATATESKCGTPEKTPGNAAKSASLPIDATSVNPSTADTVQTTANIKIVVPESRQASDGLMHLFTPGSSGALDTTPRPGSGERRRSGSKVRVYNSDINRGVSYTRYSITPVVDGSETTSLMQLPTPNMSRDDLSKLTSDHSNSYNLTQSAGQNADAMSLIHPNVLPNEDLTAQLNSSSQRSVVLVDNVLDQIPGQELAFHVKIPALENDRHVFVEIEFTFDLFCDEVQSFIDEMKDELLFPSLVTKIDVTDICDAVLPIIAIAKSLISPQSTQMLPVGTLISKYGSFAEAVIRHLMMQEANAQVLSFQPLYLQRLQMAQQQQQQHQQQQQQHQQQQQQQQQQQLGMSSFHPNAQGLFPQQLTYQQQQHSTGQHQQQQQQQQQYSQNQTTQLQYNSFNSQAMFASQALNQPVSGNVHSPGGVSSLTTNSYPTELIPQNTYMSGHFPGSNLQHQSYPDMSAAGYGINVNMQQQQQQKQQQQMHFISPSTSFENFQTAMAEERLDVMPVCVEEPEEDSFENDPEYLEMVARHQEELKRVDKEYASKCTSTIAAMEKADEAYKKEMEKLLARQGDLDKQLESMMDKMKERMQEFSFKKQYLEDLILKSTNTMKSETSDKLPNQTNSPSSSLKLVSPEHDPDAASVAGGNSESTAIGNGSSSYSIGGSNSEGAG